MKSMQQKSIAVAVSGGADSLFSLISLQEQGAPLMALHGIFFEPRDAVAREDQEKTLRGLSENCRRLGIPLHVEDLSGAFRELVVRPFVQSYARGLTPNPCALCNARIKFGLLQDAARKRGAGFIATGHYARLVREGWEGREGEQGPCDSPALMQGKDRLKDQSYFLALTSIERLRHALFPLGNAAKKDVLDSLAQRGVAVPQPKESQEVCFVPGDLYRAYLPGIAEELGIALPGPGPVLLGDGRRVGTHKGLWQYTEGQRKGLGIGWEEPLHVLAKEMEGNVLRVGPRSVMRAAGCVCENPNILFAPSEWPEQVLVKTRYRERPKPARVAVEHVSGRPEGIMRIEFLHAESAIAPGQVAAVYTGEDAADNGLRLVAGGIIAGVTA